MEQFLFVVFVIVFLILILVYVISLTHKEQSFYFSRGLSEWYATNLLNQTFTDSSSDIETEIQDVTIEPEYQDRFSYASINTITYRSNSIESYNSVPGFGPKNHLGNKDLCGPIWNQQQCGSCWYMSTLQVILAKGVKKDTSLEPQTTNIPYAYGLGNTTLGGYWTVGRNVCDGGFPIHALGILRTTQLVPANPSSYDLDIFSNTRIESSCYDSEAECISIIPNWGGSVSSEAYNIFSDTYSTESFEDISNGVTPDGTIRIVNTKLTNEQVQKLIYKLGPAVIVLNASSWDSFINATEAGAYKPASFSNPLGETPNHCVVLVGWKKRGTKLYWQVRNQWSSVWGFNGYVFIEAGEYIQDCFYELLFLKQNYIDLGGYNSTGYGSGIAGNSIGEIVNFSN